MSLSLGSRTCSHNNGGHYTENNTRGEIILVVRFSTGTTEQNRRAQRLFAGQLSAMTGHLNAHGKHSYCGYEKVVAGK